MTETRQAAEALVRRAAAFAPSTFRADARTIDVVFTTGAEVMRADPWTNDRWIEGLDVTADAVDLSRMQAGAPVLNAHRGDALADVIGVVERAWIEAGRGYATVRFSEREDVAPIVADVAAGILRNISVGYSVSQWREDEVGGMTRRTAVRWQPMEISFVPIPADAASQVRGLGTDDVRATPANPATIKETTMTEQVTAAAAPPAATIDAHAVRAEAIRAERLRAREIREAARLAGLDDAWVQTQIDTDASADAARAAALQALGAKQKAPTASVVSIVRDEGDTVLRGVEGALAARLGGGAFDGPAVDYRSATLIDMAASVLKLRGTETRSWSRPDIAKAALGLPVMGRSMQTTSDFAALLGNVQSKRLLTAYMAYDRNFLSWCARRPLPDFKPTSIVEMGAGPTLLALSEGGKIDLGVVQDSGESYNLVRYARNVALSYPAIVNDDLGGFDRMPQAFAVAAANLEGGVVYGLLATNANMSDGNAWFSAAHGNTSAQAATVDGISAVRALMRRQTDPSGQAIMVTPSVIISPIELEATMLSLFSATVVPATQATTAVNPWRGQFTIATTPFLTDTNDYFVTVAAGTGYEAVEVGYEAGNEAPQLTSYTQPDVDGVVFSLRHSFGAKAASWRTIARATA
jgi:hypothetical protein